MPYTSGCAAEVGGYGFFGAFGGDGASGARSEVRTLLRDRDLSRSSLEPDLDLDLEERLSSGLKDILACNEIGRALPRVWSEGL